MGLVVCIFVIYYLNNETTTGYREEHKLKYLTTIFVLRMHGKGGDFKIIVVIKHLINILCRQIIEVITLV